MDFVSRHDTGHRKLPAIGAGIYAETAASPAAQWLSKTARPSVSVVKLYTGFGLDPGQRLERLLYLHRLAFDAESAGTFNRADFLWQEFNGYLECAWPDDAVWDSATGAAGVFANRAEARTRLLIT